MWRLVRVLLICDTDQVTYLNRPTCRTVGGVIKLKTPAKIESPAIATEGGIDLKPSSRGLIIPSLLKQRQDPSGQSVPDDNTPQPPPPPHPNTHTDYTLLWPNPQHPFTQSPLPPPTPEALLMMISTPAGIIRH